MEKAERDNVDKLTEVMHFLLKGELPKKVDTAGYPDDEIKQLSDKTNALIDAFLQTREQILPLANGKLDKNITTETLFSSPFKQLQASLRHLTWQTQEIAKGNFNIKVDFMGDFSDAFNSMVAALAAAKKEAEEATRAKTMFFANMSHEIRTPMNAVVGFAGLLKDMPLNALQKEYVDIVIASGEHLLVLINDILDFSKAEAGQLILESVDFDLGRIVEEAIRMMAPKVKDKPVELFSKVDEKISFRVEGDPTRFRQILINLIGNAVKFTEKGSVAVYVTLSERTGGGCSIIRFSVEDTGIGIPEDKKEHVFESFSQADMSTTRKYGGTGLGLAICKAYIEKMGGRIWVESQIGKGSKFIFTVRLKEKDTIPEKNAVAPSPVEQEISCKGVRVLVAEDDKTNQILIKAILGKLGCPADIVENGQEALDRLKAEKYDICLMDLQMPVMGGLEAIKIIRNEISKDFPVIALTAAALEEDRKKCLADGMTDYLSKPINVDELKKKIAAYGKPM
ncbi:MAG: ATP-binding protein [Pseudomonadota bacterium]